MMTRGGEGGKKCRKFDDVICERPLSNSCAVSCLKVVICDFCLVLGRRGLVTLSVEKIPVVM